MPMIPTRLLPTRLGGFGQRELLSAVVPGTLVLIELWLWFTAEGGDRQGGYLKVASNQITGVSDWILAIALLVGVLAAYPLGLLVRRAAWLPFDPFLGRTRFPSGPKVRERFETEYGAAPVQRILDEHEALRHALEGTARDPFFHYAKLWLRQNQPQLAVEHHEAEINFLVAIQVPLVLASFVVWRHAGFEAFAVTLVVAAVFVWFLRRTARMRSLDETFDVMRNFLLAQWYAESEAALRRPPPAIPAPDAG
jgi:hypothetical protein